MNQMAGTKESGNSHPQEGTTQKGKHTSDGHVTLGIEMLKTPEFRTMYFGVVGLIWVIREKR